MSQNIKAIIDGYDVELETDEGCWVYKSGATSSLLSLLNCGYLTNYSAGTNQVVPITTITNIAAWARGHGYPV